MILEAILVCAGTAAVASVVGAFLNREEKRGCLSLKKYMPGDLPIITLINNKVPLNFLLDTGSNISHICPSAAKLIKTRKSKSNATTEVAGLGTVNKGVTMCKAELHDTLNHKYKVYLSISENLEKTAKYIHENTGVMIHGLLGTDFLQKYNYTIDFKSLEVYTKK